MTTYLHDLGSIAELTDSRRTALRRISELGVGAAIATIPFLKPGVAKAQSTDGDFGILNYALTLEYLERSFYAQAIDSGNLPAGAEDLFAEIRANEAAHVTLLRGAIEGAGGEPVDYTDSDFTFDGFLGDAVSVATLAQGLEDTGVRAYKGQAAAISDPGILTVALQIHSVEARHAAAIRRLPESPASNGWPTPGEDRPAPIAPVYQGSTPESNTSQGGVELTTALSGYSASDIAEAFDETLSMDEVLAIAGQFITGEEGDGND